MLMSESLEIGVVVGQAMLATATRIWRSTTAPDTICSATQERQDASSSLIAAGRLMVVIGGYPAATPATSRRRGRVPTYHRRRRCLASGQTIRHRR
jgi:4-hydroxy-3-methylbut-2-enyl diphosphate reductase IspH